MKLEDRGMKKAIILTTQRTGSTFLSYWLNSHPYAAFYNEVFLKNSPAYDAFKYYYIKECGNRVLFPLLANKFFYRLGINLFPKRYLYDYLDSLVHNPTHSAPFPKLGKGQQHHVKNQHAKLIGFKLMYEQLRFFSALEYWIVSNQTAVIHLLRRNVLKNFISKERMRQLGVGHKYKESQAKPIVFQFDRFVRYAERIEKGTQYHREMFNNSNPYIEIYYEEIFEDMETARTTILDFLELEKLEMVIPDLKQIATSSLETEVSNYAETMKTISASKYASMLQDFGCS